MVIMKHGKSLPCQINHSMEMTENTVIARIFSTCRFNQIGTIFNFQDPTHNKTPWGTSYLTANTTFWGEIKA